MKAKFQWLTKVQIDDILETLHYNIQFYDYRGYNDNVESLNKIEEVLKKYYLKGRKKLNLP